MVPCMVWALRKGEKVEGKATGWEAKPTIATGKTKGSDWILKVIQHHMLCNFVMALSFVNMVYCDVKS